MQGFVSAIEVQDSPFDLREPVQEDHVISEGHTTLISLWKMADVDYVTNLNKKVQKYMTERKSIKVLENAILMAYCCKLLGLWRVLQKKLVKNENINTVLLQISDSKDSIYYIFNLPSMKHMVKYLHAEVVFPQKDTWIKAIQANSHATWPGLTVNMVKTYCPKSDETQQRHMKNVNQRLWSTNQKLDVLVQGNQPTQAHKKHYDVFIKVLDLQEAIYTDQTSKFSYLSSRGNWYIMVAPHIDANYIYVKPMKKRTSE